MFDFFAIFPLFFAIVFVILLLCWVTLILGHISSAMSRRQISPLPRHLSTFHRICANAVVVPGHTSFIFWWHLATFFEAADLSIPQTCLNFWRKTLLLLKPSKNLIPYISSHPRCQKEGVVEEGKIGHPSGIFALFTCVVAAANPDWRRDAVPAAGPLCTHGKDTTGLAP